MADRRNLLLLLGLVLAAVACRSAPTPRAPEERPSLTLLFLGNVHGEIAPCG